MPNLGHLPGVRQCRCSTAWKPSKYAWVRWFGRLFIQGSQSVPDQPIIAADSNNHWETGDHVLKEDLLETTGTVVEKLPNAMFKVKLENEHEIIAQPKGKMRKFRIRVMVGDRVDVEMSPYDLTRGRITFRHK